MSFDTTKGVYATERSHLNYLVLDSKWEAKVGGVLDRMDEVIAYAKNQGIDFKIPYTFEGVSAHLRAGSAGADQDRQRRTADPWDR